MVRNGFMFWGMMAVLIFGLGVAIPVANAQEDRHSFCPDQFEDESRAGWQQVDKVIEAMGLREGQSVADIGGGTGYFSRPFARVVGPRGIVYCCDIAPTLLEYLQLRAKVEELSNIVTVLAARDRPMLPPASVDHIFFCNTNHHLEDRVEYYKGLLGLLKPGGQLVVVDWKHERQKMGPPLSHTVPESTVIREMEEAGWVLIRKEKFLQYQYMLIFQPENARSGPEKK